jgi:cytochrome c oxidase subunit 4
MPYVITFVALLVLTVGTFLLSRVDLGGAQIPVALSIATVKASAVAWYFMHLNEQSGVNRVFVVVAVLFVLLLIGLMIADVRTRDHVAPPPAPDSTSDQRGPELVAPKAR